MPGANISTSNFTTKENNHPDYTFPLILVTSLFFMWGFAYGLLDSLNKHFQDVLNITKFRSTLLQAAYFGGYFLMALPAGMIMKKFGYKKGIILGLCLYALGALLFYPSAGARSFNAFLGSLFILACGLCCLETASNPYVTVLGKRETSEFRLNLSQSFNGIGSFLGPFIAAKIFFNHPVNNNVNELDSVKYTYLIIAVVVLIIAFLFFRTRLPEINEENQLAEEVHHHSKPLFQNTHFVWGIIAQFFYVGAQVGIAAFFINYATESWHGTSSATAATLLGVSLILFTIGRFVGTALMKVIKPNILLAIYSIVNVILCLIVIKSIGSVSVYSLMAIFFFESIMFPTIFALGVKDLGKHTRQGGSFIIMSIVGGALAPLLMGFIADKEHSTAISYIVPLICFIVVFYYGVRGYKKV